VFSAFGLAIATRCGYTVVDSFVLVSRMADFPPAREIAGEPGPVGANFLEQCHAPALHRAPFQDALDAHWFLAWGCLIAAGVTFPWSFGWIRYETAPDNQEIYRAFVFGIHIGSFPLYSLIGPVAFNILDICAVMVLIGVFTAMWRRGRDRGAMSVTAATRLRERQVRDLRH